MIKFFVKVARGNKSFKRGKKLCSWKSKLLTWSMAELCSVRTG